MHKVAYKQGITLLIGLALILIATVLIARLFMPVNVPYTEQEYKEIILPYVGGPRTQNECLKLDECKKIIEQDFNKIEHGFPFITKVHYENYKIATRKYDIKKSQQPTKQIANVMLSILSLGGGVFLMFRFIKSTK